MPRCQHCGAEAEETAGFCSQCGLPMRPPASDPAARAGQSPATGGSATYPLLARANLLRMRGRWVEAAAACAEVLRTEPDNPSAHSLMGDIYENQGQLEQAIHWYDLALSLNPQSEADAAKKGRVQELLEARQRRADWQAAVRGREVRPGDGPLLREAIQRVIAVVGAAVCAIILVAAVLVSALDRHPQTGDPAPGVPPRRPEPAPWQPVTSLRARRILAQMSRAHLTATSHGHLAGLTIDPRDGGIATLDIDLPPAVLRRPSLDDLRQAIQRECYWLAYMVYQHDRGLRVIEVRAFGDTSFSAAPVGVDLLFAATMRTENLVVDPNARTLSPSDLATVYEQPWWDPALSG
jgi:tetratricopeptide (TPR) repeat protein